MAVAAVAAVAVFFVSPSWGAENGSEPASSTLTPMQDELQSIEEDALLARAHSLEVLGRFLWGANLSASRARLKAAELRIVARSLLEEAKEKLAAARTQEELDVATSRVEIVRSTSTILNHVADRLERTRGTRRKIRILGLELSREAWKVVRENELTLTEDQPVLPGQLYKENPPAPSPRERAFLRQPRKDYLTYVRGALSTQELVRRDEGRKARAINPLPQEELYNREGAVTLSPLDQDHRSKRIWWSKPPEELAWKTEQW
jgi:hypothetical protein